MDNGNRKRLGLDMAEMVIFEDGRATILGGESEEPQDIVIYCDLCNEPLAITPKINDEVFITCLRCHAVSHIALTVTKEIDDQSPQE
jgi:hypothetical protein